MQCNSLLLRPSSHLLCHAELPVFPFPLRLAEALEGVESVLVLALVSPLHRHLRVLLSPVMAMK